MPTVYLAFGSNQGRSTENIQIAIDSLAPYVSVALTAPFYRSHAVGYTDQPDFTNTAVVGTTDLEPAELLKFLKLTEQKIGRVERFRWGPREIDIDIIFYGDQVVQSEELEIPHPEYANRDFVLRPLIDLNPDLIDPKNGQTIRRILEQLPAAKKSGLKKIDEKHN